MIVCFSTFQTSLLSKGRRRIHAGTRTDALNSQPLVLLIIRRIKEEEEKMMKKKKKKKKEEEEEERAREQEEYKEK